MAQREGQVLQIFVIFFAFLAIVLAVTTYMFYSQAENARADREKMAAEKSALQTNYNKLEYQAKALQYVLGLGGVKSTDVDLAKTAAGGQADPLVDEIMTAFNSDMQLYGAQAGAEGTNNYRTLPAFLITSITKKNTSVVDANDQTATLQSAKAASEAAEKARADQEKAAKDAAVADLAKEKGDYDAERARLLKEKDTIAAQLAAKDKTSKDEVDRISKERDALLGQVTTISQTVTGLRTRLEEEETEKVNLFESPDGKVTWVNQKQRLVWINVGRADGLMRQTTFSVFDHDINGVSNAKPKARIEVIRLSEDHLAECRILEDEASNPILPNDVIHTPSWSPGSRIHFAIAGFIDLDKDGISDFDQVLNIIRLNGGVVDAQVRDDGTRTGNIDFNTRYLVLGELPTEKTSEKARNEFTKIRGEGDRYGTDIITVEKLLTQMGWKAEERTVKLAGSKAAAEFRTRKPGTKNGAAAEAPPAEADPGAAPMPEAAPPAGADPFAAPMGADPFATPATPAPMPMASAADPFADPK
jgi:hypothetical protein